MQVIVIVLVLVYALVLVLVRSIPQHRRVLALAPGFADNIAARRWSSVASACGHLGLSPLFGFCPNFFGISGEIEPTKCNMVFTERYPRSLISGGKELFTEFYKARDSHN